jgi:glycosyltransferase involved in cell wall biosynthesis
LTIGLGDYMAAAMPNADVVTIPSGLDSGSWSQVDRSSARKALGIAERDFVVLFTGRIAHVKGIDVLLDAVERLAPSTPDLKVLIIGPLSGSFDSRDEHVDPYAREMMELSHGLPVRFLGFINNRDLEFRQYLAAADVFVLPSRVEPQGLVVLESLAMGTPVIGSATGGIPDMVSADVGYLFPPEDAESLAARIKEAHDHPQDLERMRKTARVRVESHFSWDSAADRYLAEFKRVVQDHARLGAGIASSRVARAPGE